MALLGSASRRMTVVGLVVAGIAVLANTAAAVGPGRPQRAVYSWPPAHLPAKTPTRAWYAPLLLAHHSAANIVLDVPCTFAAPLRPRTAKQLVIATARRPGDFGGLYVERQRHGRRLEFGSLGGAFTAVRTLRSAPPGCRYHLEVDGRHWRLQMPHGSRRGKLAGAPAVTAFVSELDLAHGPRPSLTVTTSTWAADATARQIVLWTIGGGAILGALLLVAWPLRLPRIRVRRVLPALRPVDAIVGVTTLAWWVVAPVLYDDGWVKARQANFAVSHGFSNYFDSFGVNLPSDYWVEWLQHWLVQSTSSLLLLRLPAVVLIALTWAMCRIGVARMFPAGRPGSTAAEFALAAGFLVNVIAWLMTLRPEPLVAALTMVSFLCALRLTEGWSIGAVTVATVAVVLALTAHPAGAVALAPIAAIAPTLYRQLRTVGRDVWMAIAAVLLAGIALLVWLAFVGSDVHQRLDDAKTIRQFAAHSSTWRDEFDRYSQLVTGGSVVRRASIALYFSAIAGFLFRGARRRSPVIDLGALSLVLGLVLLIPTPSKWVWHFGTLAGLGAVALAGEAGRLAALRRRPAAPLAALVFVAATVIGIDWSWWPRLPWNAIDLRSTSEFFAAERFLSFPRLTLLLVAGALVAVAVTARRRRRAATAPYTAAAIIVPLVAAPVIAFAPALFARDAFATPGWTLPRQNLDWLRSNDGCGLADDVRIDDPASSRPLPVEPHGGGTATIAWPLRTPRPPAPLLTVPTRTKPVGSAYRPSAWYRAPRRRLIGFFATGIIAPDSVSVQWARRKRSGRIAVLDTESVSLVPGQNNETSGITWWFQSDATLPKRPRRATLLRLLVKPGPYLQQPLVVSAPVTYSNVRLSSLIRANPSGVLIAPDIRLYFPCARQPRLADGIAQPPSLIVEYGPILDSFVIGDTSPFWGARDVYGLRELSTADTPDLPPGLVVAVVDHRPSGLAYAPMRRLR